ncbi:hypothetical protein GCM10009677_08070 [Sphaerisporangium rubeum]|uniref:Uncharacterized protein n=1 Tax=Sphaerisporangium rubeum TaxID=321317 RepID=A0A7X0M857_9ACTN|nr:hypothetical protein [Sphaerisporangium rubeum]MBB6475473.1 hypothetical protein [Sphaerisporangium rubeum]
MDARGGLVPALWSGTSTAVKLLIASLAFAGAYSGVEATRGDAAPPVSAHAPRTVVLSARAMPAEETRVPATGVISVAAEPGTGCVRTYRAQSVVESGGGDAVLYGWRLQRWSATGREWLPYTASATAGFAGGDRAVTWQPRIVDNPGLYRVQLAVNGKAVVSEKFRVSC